MAIASYLRTRKIQQEEARKSHDFKTVALPHLGAAYRLARWLTRNHDEAEEIVQEAYLCAFRRFDTYNGGDARAWILAIVRNTFYSSLRQRHAGNDSFDEETYCPELTEAITGAAMPDKNPEAILLQRQDVNMVQKAIEELPVSLREVLVLRTFDDLSYNEIAMIVNIPVGTVMSRLARARTRLARCLKSMDTK
jgi:RNA polymerase sigma factor (sigma-70 family)